MRCLDQVAVAGGGDGDRWFDAGQGRGGSNMAGKSHKSVVRETPFSSISLAEREAFYQSVDREFTKAETRPLTSADRRDIAAARGRRRSATGNGSAARVASRSAVKSVSVQIESALLAEADRYAKAHGLKRTELVAVGLRLAMAAGNHPARRPKTTPQV